MATDESVTLDPVEFVPERVELGLDELGIRVREADWGDSEHELFLVKRELGEIPADRHPPNRKPTFKLEVREDRDVNIAEAAIRLQKKIGLIQREGGFARRDLDTDSGFVGSVATRVHSIGLGGIDGWMMAHRKRAPEVTLNMETDPYLYGVERIESSDFSLSSARALEYELKVSGSAPGLCYISFKNEGAANLRGIIEAFESRDHPQDATKTTTAKLFYECENLTLKSSSKATRTGASPGGSNNVVRATGLTAGWTTILESLIVSPSAGHMTHIGSRRLWLRVYQEAGVKGDIELRLQYRPLGALGWSEAGGIVATPLAGNFALMDMGTCRPERAVIGNQRWEWRVLARAPKGSGAIDLDCAFILPTEHYLKVNAPDMSSANQSSATKLAGKGETIATGAGTAAWSNPENIKASDNARAIATVDSTKTSNYLRASNFGFAVPGDATIIGIIPTIERHASVASRVKDIGLHINTNPSTVFSSPRVAWSNPSFDPFWPTADEKRVYELAKAFKEGTFTPAQVNSSELFCWIWVFNDFASCEARVDAIELTVLYTLPEDSSICYQTRSAEIRSEGAFRQHESDDVWARLVPDGFFPQAPPSGLEDRFVRGLFIPSVGDLAGLADSGSHSGKLKFGYHPGYHFTSEAEPPPEEE